MSSLNWRGSTLRTRPPPAATKWQVPGSAILPGRSRGISMQRRLTDLNRYVRGWIGYFSLARQFDDIADLDGWTRRRVRMCYWKQWRHPRTKVRNLVRLGVNLDMAIKHAVTRKRYWRLSRTPAMRYDHRLLRHLAIVMPQQTAKPLATLDLRDRDDIRRRFFVPSKSNPIFAKLDYDFEMLQSGRGSSENASS